MKKNVIVSLADANYFPLLEELIGSIKRFQESKNIAICMSIRTQNPPYCDGSHVNL